MQKVTCYKTPEGAMRALDNGGRFFNLFTSAGDAVVSKAELTKAAGTFAKPNAFLFFEMALRGLGPSARKSVFDRLEPELRRSHAKHGPTDLAPSAFEREAHEKRAYILEGHVHRAPDTVRTGTILMPMMIGKTMTMMPMPVSETCHVFELSDGSGRRGSTCLVVIPKQSSAVVEDHFRLGGFARQMTFGKEPSGRKSLVLEPCYYTPLG